MTRILSIIFALCCCGTINACGEWNDYTVESTWDQDAQFYYGGSGGAPEYVQNDCCYGQTPCLMSCCDFHKVHLQAEFLYFKPTLDDSFYAITSTPNFFAGNFFPEGKRHNNESDYKPGFRVGLMYDVNCNNYWDLKFTYLKAGSTDRVSGLLYDTIGWPGDGAQSPEDSPYAGFARRHDHIQYYAGDATFNRLNFNCCPDNLSFYVGLHYAYIQHKNHFRSAGVFRNNGIISPVFNTLKSESAFWGIGPQLGADYHYTLCCSECLSGNVSLFANARAALLCSRTKCNFKYNSLRTGPVGVDIHNNDIWRVSPMGNARVGARYNFNCFCLNGSLEAGYEFLWYSKCVDSITGYDVAFPGNSFDKFSNLNLQGPFLALNFCF